MEFVIGLLVVVILCLVLGYFLRWFVEPKPSYVGDLIIAKVDGEPIATFLEMDHEGIIEDLRNGQTVYFLVRSKNNVSYNENLKTKSKRR